jgi:hypothetical protein
MNSINEDSNKFWLSGAGCQSTEPMKDNIVSKEFVACVIAEEETKNWLNNGVVNVVAEDIPKNLTSRKIKAKTLLDIAGTKLSNKRKGIGENDACVILF